MKTTEKEEAIPPLRRGANTYKPEDIRRWGVERFMKEVAPQKPFSIPDLGFTEEENRCMDALLKEEK